jgi:hypothetical protein
MRLHNLKWILAVSSGLRGRRIGGHTILKLADHALSNYGVLCQTTKTRTLARARRDKTAPPKVGVFIV